MLAIVLISITLGIALFAGFGAWIAGEKNRDAGQGAIIGGIFGPIGILVLVLLPAKPQPKARPAGATRRSRTLMPGEMPDDWGLVPEPEPEPEPPPASEEEDRALRYLNGS